MRVVIAAVFVFALSTGRARAGTIDVSAYACVPTADSIQGDLYSNDISPGPVMFWNGSATGTIVFNCAIPNAVINPTSIELNFSNNNTCAGCAGDYVSIQYMKMSKGSGALTVIKTLSSSALGLFNGSSTLTSSISDTYNDILYTYFLRITMYRASATNSQTFRTAAIW